LRAKVKKRTRIRGGDAGRIDKKLAGYSHRTATTAYPCYIPVLGEFSRSWSCKTCQRAKGKVGGWRVGSLWDSGFFARCCLYAPDYRARISPTPGGDRGGDAVSLRAATKKNFMARPSSWAFRFNFFAPRDEGKAAKRIFAAVPHAAGRDRLV